MFAMRWTNLTEYLLCFWIFLVWLSISTTGMEMIYLLSFSFGWSHTKIYVAQNEKMFDSNETEKEIACTPSGGYHAQEHTELSIKISL